VSLHAPTFMDVTKISFIFTVVEKQFKKYDPCMTGAIEVKHMVNIIKELLKEDPHLYTEDEIFLQIEKRAKGEIKYEIHPYSIKYA